MVVRATLAAACCAAGILWADLARAEPKSVMVPGGAYIQRHPSYQPDNPAYHDDRPAVRPHTSYGQYPWYGSAWGVPTYNWGNFGVTPYPDTRCHKGYSKDFYQWQQWRRY